MADRLITGVVYGNHAPPKKKRPLKDVIKIPAILALVLLIGGAAIYKYINYREERLVREFLQRIAVGDYDVAFASWDPGATYRMKEFVEDWGPSGYYTKGMTEARVVTSHRSGSSAVNVRVFIAPYSNSPKSQPIQLRVDRETQKLAFAP